MMLPDFFSVIKNVSPNNSQKSTLYGKSIKVFVTQLSLTTKPGVRIPALQDVPAVALSSILEEMASYPSLGKTLHQELSDPVLFMRMFIHHRNDLSVLENCLRKASLVGKPVVPDMVKNWCAMMTDENITPGSTSLVSTVESAVQLGSYLLEAGWWFQSKEVLDIAFGMMLRKKESRVYSNLRIECVQKVLRAEAQLDLRAKADATCNVLLALVENVTDKAVLVQVFLEVANHHFEANRLTECHRWNTKAMELITETTPVDIVIRALQMEAKCLFSLRRYDDGKLVISQAIHRARSTFGRQHRRYADTLYTYGTCLLMTDDSFMIIDAISILLETLFIFTKLYGKLTPQAAIIQSSLAYGLYYRDYISGKFELALAYEYIMKATALAQQIIPERRHFIIRCGEIRTMILDEWDEILAESGEAGGPTRMNNQLLTIAEIKQKCRQNHPE
ncbi:uncharacterized protein LOC134207582 [Armigeres subalbatus]|uniref:uncharacterized protein LOC134207582 n=1 Tax=Armigeres subalbatus TaxID=124917 RepID=UPI002ED3F9FF